MFRFSEQVWKGMQMGEVVTILTSISGHALVKSFSGSDLTLQPFSTGKLFNVSEEPVSDLQSLSALLTRLLTNMRLIAVNWGMLYPVIT